MSNFERGSLKQRAIAVAVASCYLTSAQANPTGASVAAGNVVFDVNGKMLTITNTPGAIINWQQFSIQKDEITRFIQQNASSAVLNRVGGANNPSYILGTLRSELTSGAIGGRVFLVNPSGITFGAGSVINVGGLVASTLGMSDADFAIAAAGGRMRFIGAGGESELRNAGEIRTAEGGHVYLIAPKVVNEGATAGNQTGGLINSPKGEIIVAAGTSVELVNAGTPDIRVELTAPANEVLNAGKIVAESGRVGIYGTLIKNSGLVSASAATLGDGGKIVFKALKDVTLDASSRLEANGAKGGDVTIQAETGTLLARGTIEAKGAAEKGGTIHLLGSQVGLVDGAQADASGQSGGGTVLVGGDQRGANPDVQNADAVYLGAETSIRADALDSGDGGKVVVYSKDATRAYGSLSARGSASGAGGSVETSGRYLEIAQGPDVAGGLGGGTWLIDPYNIDIVAGAGTSNNTGAPDFTPSGDNSQIGANLINSQLNAGTNVTVDTGGPGSAGTQAGDINVNAAISKGAVNTATLTLNAANDINVNSIGGAPTIFLNSGAFTANAGRNMTVNSTVQAPTMNVTVGGNLSVIGNAGAFTGLTALAGQTISAGSIDVRSQGGSATIQNAGSGDQTITVNGTGPGIDVRTTAPGPTGTFASIFNGSTGTQTVTLNNGQRISLNAGFGNAVIQANGTQIVSANSGDIQLTNSTTGFLNSFAGILAPNQTISASRDVTLTANFATGTSAGTRIGSSSNVLPTNLTLNAGRDVVLTGGIGSNINGAALGSSVTTALANNITVNASGRMVMNSGADAGTRVGGVAATLGGGDIKITAASIEMNGAAQNTAIRTLGRVDLTANGIGGSITQGAKGIVQADTLTIKTNGNASLTGPNQVSTLSAPATGLPSTGIGGNLSFNNVGALNAGSITASGTMSLSTGGDLNVTDRVTSGGAMNVNAAGALNVNGAGLQDAILRSSGGQTITAQSVNLTAQNNRRSNIENVGTGNQTITATAGGMNLTALGGSGVAQIINSALGASQTVSMTGLLNVLGGTTGVPNGNRNSGIFQNVNGAQQVSASGITLQGSGTGTVAAPSGALISSLGSQTIDVGSGNIGLVGGAGGSGNSTLIISTGDQSINAGGTISVTGGTLGSGNRAGISTNGNQTITGNANIAVTGGASGGAANNGNFAFISGGVSNLQTQKINAGSISVTSGAGGIDNSATILGAKQVITTTGNFTVSGSGSSGPNNGSRVGGLNSATAGATDLTLNVGGDVILTAGANANGAGSLASNNVTPPFDTNITVNAAGSVILNAGAGSGSRIGSSNGNVGGGNISVTAGNSIQLNGNATQTAAIRTTGNVTLNAGTITEGTNGLIIAGGLTTTSSGSTGLTGANQVASLNGTTTTPGGNLTFNNSGSLNVTGISSLGNTALTNAGSMSVSGLVTANGTLGLTTTGAGASLTVTNTVSSTGAATLNVAGTLAVNASGTQNAVVSSNGQTVNAQSLTVSAQDGRLASLSNSGASQTIAVSGGAGIDVVANSAGTAQIVSGAPGAIQTITATNADHLNVNGAGGNALINANLGTQTISITGNGANAINLGSSGAQGSSTLNGLTQSVTAGVAGQSGSITIVGPAANNRLAAITTSTGVGGQTQTVSTSGTISVIGGTASAQGANSNSGIFHSRQGQQSVTAANIVLQGGASGSNNGAFVNSLAGGDQTVNVAGSISITGGTGVAGNKAGMNATNASQTITANAISITGGASGGIAGNGNNGFLQSSGATKVQTINAGSISIASGAGGVDNSGTITGATQAITATGNVTVTGGATTGTSNGSRIGGQGGASPSDTNLTLNAGGNVILTGGTADGSGARLGSASTTTALANNIAVNAGGSVILNGGTEQGAAIGYSTQGTTPAAGGTISVTAGNAIQLNGGPTNTSIRTTGDVSLTTGTISEGTNGFILANNLTLKTAGNASLTGPNQVSSLSSPGTAQPLPVPPTPGVGGDLSFNNTAALSLGSTVVGGALNLTTTAGDLNVTNLVTSGGAMNVNAAGTLNVNGAGLQDAILRSSGGQTITAQSMNLTAQNNRLANIENQGSGSQTITATAGGINMQALGGSGVAQIINRALGGSQTIAMTGLLNVLGGTTTGLSRNSGIFQNVNAQQQVSSSGITLQASGTGTGTTQSGAVISSTGSQSIDVGGGNIDLIGGAGGSANSASIGSTGDQTINAAGGTISLTGGTIGSSNRATITTSGNQTINGNPNIVVTGGASGTSNLATIAAGVGRQQIINAGSINVTAGAGGTDNSSTISGSTQTITATGNVAVSGSSGGGTLTGARIGGLGGATPSDTNLTLNAGGDVTLTGGSAINSGARLGSTVTATPLTNNVAVNAGGSVILNGGTGTGAAIGYSLLAPTPPAGGTISVTARNSIQLNGGPTQTAIRTLNDVTLDAGTISEGANGGIFANNLTLKIGGNADLTGPNLVSSLSAPSTVAVLPGLPPVSTPGVGGNLSFNNTGALSVGSTAVGGALNLTTTSGDLNVTSVVTSGGAMNVNAAGVLNVNGAGVQSASISSAGGQTISAQSLNVSARDGRSASLVNTGSGNQTIAITGGNVEVQTLVGGGSASIRNEAPGGNQTISVTDGQRINVNAAGGGIASLNATNGVQSLSISGSGANAITVGSAGALGITQVVGRSQSVTAGLAGQSGSIAITGTAAPVATTGFITTSGNAAETQTFNTSGTLSVTGGTAASGAGTGIFHNRSGEQTINAAGVSVQGGASGSGNFATITASGRGQQTINAGSISVSSGAGGIDSSATITGAKQAITTTGNFAVSGGSSTGANNGSRVGGLSGATPSTTDLTLNVGGDVIITAGSAVSSGAGLGSNNATVPLANNINVNAAGSVILNSGSEAGARIGSAGGNIGAGTISVTAGNSLQLNGGPVQSAAIRTTGDVLLTSGTISGGANGFVVASNLTLKTGGNAELTGRNQVSSLSAPGTVQPLPLPPTPGVGGNLSFNNTGALNVGSTVVGGALSLTTTSGDLNVTSLVTSGGAMNVNAAGALNVNGVGLQDAILRSSGGQTITAQSVNLTAQNNRRSNIENVGTGNQTITATAGGMNLQALGGSGVAQIINSALGASQTVGMTGLLNVLGGTTGVPNGSRNSGIFQNVNSLQKVTSSGITLQASGTGTSNATASGALISSSGSQVVDAGAGTISLTGGAGGTNNSAAISSSGDQIITAAGGSISLTGGTVGNNNRANISSGGNQTINGNPNITVTGGASGVANSVTISAGAGKQQTINAGSISVSSGAGGIDNSGTITGATQSITATGNVTVSGGATTGTSNGSRIGGLGGGNATDTNLTLTAGGDVILTGGSADGSGARLGSSATTSALTNNVTVNAGGSVILNGGTAQGAAIGYSTQDSTTPPAGGTISVTAGNSIQLNGGQTRTEIRTLGDVTLSAGTTISEGANGAILANNLTTTSVGDTSLGGPNRVSSFSGSSTAGSVTFNNIGALAVNSVVAANNAALTNLGALSVNGPMNAGGTLSITADSVNGAGNIATGGGFTVNVAGESLLSGVISGAGGLSKLGTGTLTVSGDNTYAGETDVLAGTLALGGSDRTNSGVVNIFSGATYRGSAGTFNNAGVIAGNGTLDVSATSFTNSGTLRPGGSEAIGTLAVLGNASFTASSLIDIEAQGAGNGNHDVLAITGAASLGGNLNVTHINGYAPLTDDAITPVTYASRTGTLGISPDSWLPTYNPASLTLVFDPNVNRWIGTSGNWNVAANWSRGHTPLAFETALIDVAGNQLVTVSDGARAAGKLRSSEDFLISGGSLSLGGPSFFYGALSLTGGTLQGAGSITVNGAFNWSGGSLGGSGQFITAPSAVSTLAPSAQNLLLGRTWLNQGHVTWQSSNGRDLVIAEGASLVNALDGEFTLAAAHGGNIKGDGVFRNEGTVDMNGTDKSAIKTGFTNGATGVLNVNSGTLKLKRSASNEGSVRIAADATLELKQDYINYGRLSGNGILDATRIRFTNLGVLAPGGNDGLGIGTFTIRGDYRQGSTGVLDMGLGGVAAGQYDVLAVSGKAFLDGTLQTSAVNGYVPVASDSFKLITYKSRSGAFSALTAPAGLALDADYTKRFGIFELE